MEFAVSRCARQFQNKIKSNKTQHNERTTNKQTVWSTLYTKLNETRSFSFFPDSNIESGLSGPCTGASFGLALISVTRPRESTRDPSLAALAIRLGNAAQTSLCDRVILGLPDACSLITATGGGEMRGFSSGELEKER